ncbi:Short-chain collagen C4 (Fragment) [Geodia barretti]|uniref:Short-chain collagen C4 n=1 Tax=Geodia barretti TaxID=519541 RepID=A0AA35TE26_GEOBA
MRPFLFLITLFTFALVKAEAVPSGKEVTKRQAESGDSNERLPPFIELLRGRDGRDGRDGEPGPKGSPGATAEKGDTGPQGPPGPSSGGVTYIRWGRTTCPNTPGTELVYKGWAAGSYFSHTGGGSNYQCVTEEPQNLAFGPGTAEHSYMYGVEYKIWGNTPRERHHLQDDDVPCAVCYVSIRVAHLMIPGRYTCPPNWTREYYGYLMAERYNHHRSTFECVDASPEAVVGGHAWCWWSCVLPCGASMWQSTCPPYEQEKEMTCAVCTR